MSIMYLTPLRNLKLQSRNSLILFSTSPSESVWMTWNADEKSFPPYPFFVICEYISSAWLPKSTADLVASAALMASPRS